MTQHVSAGGRTARPPANRRLGGRSRSRGGPLSAAFLLPSLLFVGGSMAFALLLLGSISLRDVELGTLEAVLREPLTLVKYAELIADSATWRSFGVSLVYVVGSTVIPFVIGLVTALVLNQRMPGQRLLRTLALVPWAVPGVTATVAFMWMLQPTYGVWNYVLRSLGLLAEDVNWFASPETALLAVIIPTSWKAYPFFTLMLLAGLQSIGKEQYEAASLDGAGHVAKFRWITLPSLAPFIAISVIFNAMYSFREFDFIYASTRGGPAGATETTSVRIFNLAFESFDFGSASALGVVTFLLVGVLVFFLLRRNYKGSLEGFL